MAAPGFQLPQLGSTASRPAVPTPFPARTLRTQGMVEGVSTEVAVTYYSDKILIIVSQEGSLGHWVHVPLSAEDAAFSSGRRLRVAAPTQYQDEPDVADEGLDILPLGHLTATTLLGAGNAERDVFGQLLATQIGTTLMARNAQESRLLVLGMGLTKAAPTADQPRFVGLVSLVVECLESVGRSR